MATIFGKEVAKLRIDQGVKLRELADHFGVSSSYLSAIEAGKKNVPENLVAGIAEFFELDCGAKIQLRNLAEMSKREVRIRLKDADEQSRELAVEFARNFDDLSAEDTDAIRKIWGTPGEQTTEK